MGGSSIWWRVFGVKMSIYFLNQLQKAKYGVNFHIFNFYLGLWQHIFTQLILEKHFLKVYRKRHIYPSVYSPPIKNIWCLASRSVSEGRMNILQLWLTWGWVRCPLWRHNNDYFPEWAFKCTVKQKKWRMDFYHFWEFIDKTELHCVTEKMFAN